MSLNLLPLGYASSYEGKAFITLPEGGKITFNISFNTDATGAIKDFVDSLPGGNPLRPDQVGVLFVVDKLTGRRFDLRFHNATARADLLSMAEEALREGADINFRIKQNSTALHWAAARGKANVARWLIEHGADPDPVDEMGWTPLFLAAKAGNDELIEYLTAKGARTTAVINGQEVSLTPKAAAPVEALFQATEQGDLRSIKARVKEGADINGTVSDGWTPLIEAVIHDPEIVEFFLQQGADPNIATPKGYTALMRAAGRGQESNVKLLLAAGADINACDCEGLTARDMAFEANEIETYILLGKAHAAVLIEESARAGKSNVSGLLPLEDMHLLLIATTRSTVGGIVKRLDVTFAGGTAIKGCKVIQECIIEVPANCLKTRLNSVSVPLNQGG